MGEGRESNIDVREEHPLAASWTFPNQGPNLQPRHVPQPGIKPATLHFGEWHPIKWATPVRASSWTVLRNTGVVFLSAQQWAVTMSVVWGPGLNSGGEASSFIWHCCWSVNVSRVKGTNHVLVALWNSSDLADLLKGCGSLWVCGPHLELLIWA